MLDDHYRSLKEHMSALRVHDHVCLAYSDREQQITAIAQYLKDGIERGQKCVYLSEKTTADFVLTVLKQTGLDVDKLLEDGALALVTPQEFYLRKGYFDPDDVIVLARTMIAQCLAEGYSAMRCAADMSWMRAAHLSPEIVLDWESKVQCIFEEELVSICQYNTNIFDAKLVQAVLDGHPVAINGGSVIRNPSIQNGLIVGN